MRVLMGLALLIAMFAGCAESEAPEPEDDFGQQIRVDETTGAIRGLVVDNAITPIQGVSITALGGGETLSTTSDKDGEFVFDGLSPGTYVVKAQHPLYAEQQTSTVVEAGLERPPIVRMLMEKLFEQDPYFDVQKYKGWVGCAYNFFVSSTCVNDYTRIAPVCGNGCAPQVTGIVDQREFQSYVDANWQSIVWEMAWTSSVSGTADEMQITVSFADRIGASHWYTSGSMGQPYRLQCDVGVVCQEQQSGENGEQMIAPEGQDDLWNMISAGDTNVALQQTIEVFQSNFYYGPAPEDWSFIAGDPNPY